MDEPDLSTFEVVLCRAEEPGNVGAVCRAMKTMGLGRLSLAGCPEYDEGRLRAMAVHAADVYESACRFPDLASALAETSLSAGFTRRRGARRKSFSLSVEDFAARVSGGASHRFGGRVALVFGNERSGLDAREIGLCSLAVHIPTSEAFPSLNLAQAVQIACYELRRRALGPLTGSAVAVTRATAEEAVARISEDLRALGFFSQSEGETFRAFLRDSVERSSYSLSELRYFESIFRKTAGLARHR
ncbi:MAG TPA: RNA methyltransferase [Rectinemataceae bacterium]|nr:RNA methyltransferase [Rectinemataceae bacterium]